MSAEINYILCSDKQKDGSHFVSPYPDDLPLRLATYLFIAALVQLMTVTDAARQ